MKELQLIQSALKAPKGQTNAFGKYKYRSCEDILNAVKPLLAEQECSLTITDEIVLIGDRYYIKATAKLYNQDGKNFGQDGNVSVSAFAREPLSRKGMDESQITGTASSYARKYALNGLFCIDDTKDADTMKPPVNGPKLPSRASVNGELLELRTPEEYTNYAKAFQKKHTKGAWGWLSGKRGDKIETWKMLFETHRMRVHGTPPVNANQSPEDLQKEWSGIASRCADLETVKTLETQLNQNKLLDTPENKKILDTLFLAHGE